ncbi:hypothetical protein L2E82_40708 [Cichorium intybus]|uniref:Uncharacterized protein n=1 Tax=Cichorium intybus TaxID=13427 RepID=A0ACB9AL77_CICIN|nr:hypothetical protein L2E82_40708 [Cichorium intybus]
MEMYRVQSRLKFGSNQRDMQITCYPLLVATEINANSDGQRSKKTMDPDDIFGDSLNLEDTHLNEGYKEGYDTGFASGKDDGREVGLKTGFITGEELGFYRGCIDIWISMIRVEPTCFSTRVQKKIKEMDELVSKYPILDPENENVTDIMGLLRLKFRAICATLNLKLEYKGYPKASDLNEIQF